MDAVIAIGGAAAFIAGVWGLLWVIRWGNRQGALTPGQRAPEAIAADYKRAGLTVEDGLQTQVVKGTLQSVPFLLTLYAGGQGMARGVLEVQDVSGADFSVAREVDEMRLFLRLGSGHALQTSDAGIPALDAALPEGAERDAVRALFHLGFDQLERREGSLRAMKASCPVLPELGVLRQALAHLGVLRPGGGT